MKRIRNLGGYQKTVLLLLAAMVVIFTILYPVTIAREGFAYRDAILVPRQENGNTVYSGKIQGKDASFTVYGDGTVEFQYGDKSYGPYVAREDPTAVPETEEADESMTGMELRQGEKIIFRRGNWMMWFGGIALCVITAVSILFADELFRWGLSLWIQNADQAEPADWVITWRYIVWSVTALLTLLLFITGPQ